MSTEKKSYMSPDFMRGFDASACNDFAPYKNSAGTETDIFELLCDANINCVRLRLWNDPHSPDNPEFPGNSDLVNVIDQAVRAKKFGLKVMLDFHYSDYWADPGQQHIPAAWLDCTTSDAMAERLHDFTADTLKRMAEKNALPDYVQIGNEINPGILTQICKNGKKTDAPKEIKGSWDAPEIFTKYLASGCAAVRQFAPNAKIVLHVAEGGSLHIEYYFNMFDSLDYDIMAVSYYPFEKSHKTLCGLVTNMKKVAAHNKGFMVVETGWCYKMSDPEYAATGYKNMTLDGTTLYPGVLTEGETLVESLENQVNVVRAVNEVVAQNGGLGSFFWGGEFKGNYRSLFDAEGKPLESLNKIFRD